MTTSRIADFLDARFWELQFEKSFAMILVLAMLITFIGPIGCATLTSYTTIQSNGTVVPSQVVAISGSARDIQDAVNIAAAQGLAKVVIPEGTFDFVGVGESWMTVNVPDGVSIFGASTERTSGLPVPEEGMNPNNQVAEWRTVLRMPFEAPEDSIFFTIRGANVRVSDIQLVGYREIDPSSTRHYTGFDIRYSADFRIDHVYFRNVCGAGILVQYSNGVVDHSRFVNNPFAVFASYASCTVRYGIVVGGDGVTWETNIQDVLGRYTSRSIYIEDNYFEGWRHTVASNMGAHYVYRYNTERQNGYGTIDGHGHEPFLSTRCIEAYNNDFGERSTQTDSNVGGANMGVQLRGGGGVFFNNTVDGYGVATGPEEYSAFVCMVQYTPNDYPDEQIKNVWIWGNQLTPVDADLWDVAIGTVAPGSQIRENYEFFLRAPDQTLDGFEYTPYQYSHPLATE